MNVKMIGRILDRRAIILYFLTVILLVITCANKEGITAIGLLGGFNSGTGALNVIEIIRWNICVLPPVVITVLFMMSEIGSLSVYTVMRSKNIKHWFGSRYIVIVMANLIYIFSTILIATFLNTKTIYLNEGLYRFMLIFFLHTTMMSLLSVALLTLCKNTSSVFLLFFLVEGFGVVIGSIIPSASKYMLAFWGMAQSKTFLLSSEHYHLLITSSFMLIIIVLCSATIIGTLKKHNPAASSISL